MNIYRSTKVVKNGKSYDLGQLSWVFDCPCCEYLITSLTKDGAETLQHVHFVSSPSIHLKAMQDANWDSSPLSSL